VRVNGRPITPGQRTPLRPGDELDLGTVGARFEVQ
jgi:hypothetical protein